MKKGATVFKFSSYRRHQIFYDKTLRVFLVAIKRDGTDNYFRTLEDAWDAIDRLEDRKGGQK